MVGSESVCIFSPLVTGEEWAVIPSEIAKKIESFFTEKVEELITSKALLETNRYNAEKNLSEVREELDKVTEENEDLRTRFEVASNTITTLEEQVSILNVEFSKLQTTSRKLEEDAAEFRHQRNLAVDERDEHLKMLQRRNSEIERMQADIKSLMEQLESAINTKCEALAKSDAVESMKLTLEYKEKRIDQERGLLNKQVQSLTEELHLKTEELLNMRRDNTSRCIQLETKLSEKTQELEVAVEQIKSLTELNNNLTSRIEELSQNLANQRETEGKINESYSQEIDAKTKLANAYQQMYEESKQYADSLKEALDEVQELLKNATNKYGELETKHKENELAHEEIIIKKNDYIALLKTELESANELLENSKQFKINKDIDELSPTAATTANLLKTGMSFTELYSKYVAASEKVLTLQEENARLNNYINNIVKEIENKGPLIKKLKEDFSSVLDANDQLRGNNDELLMEVQMLKDSNIECRRLEHTTSRENARLQKDIADLSRQVCHLLQEVEQCRSGSSGVSLEMDFGDSISSADIITKKLVTFNDIQDLQQNNRKLLSLVRELSEKQEEAEAFDPAAVSNLRTKLDNLRDQQQELLEEKEKQSKMMETLKNQRDMYKNLYSQAVKGLGQEENFNAQESTDSNKTKDSLPDTHNSEDKSALKELETQLANLKKHMEELKKERETYRQEKAATEKMLDEQIESLRKENKDLTTLNCKLVAQHEMNEEKFKVLKNNMEVLKKQITALEKQNKIFNDTSMKHELTISYLRDDAMQAHSKLSKAEVMLANLEKENSLLKEFESRIRKEYDSLSEQTRSQHIIHSNIELIKATLERCDSEGKLRLEARLDEAHRECSALRRRLQEEQDRFRELTEHLQTQTKTAAARFEEEKAVADKLRKELGELREELGSKNGQIDELTKKIKLSIMAIPESHNEGKKIRSLEEQIENAQAEIETLKAKLKSAKESSEQYCNIAEDAEKQMKFALEERDKFQTEVEKQNRIVKELQERCSELEGELSIQMDDQDMANAGRQTKHTQLQEELNVRSLDLKASREQLESCRSECKQLIEDLKAVENKYAREVMLHSADLQKLTDITEELNATKSEIGQIRQECENAKSELEVSKASWKTQEEYLIKGKKELETRLSSLDTQNSLLLSQLDTLNSQLVILQTQVSADNQNQSLNESLTINRSFAEDEVKSSEQLIQIIKYLRQEKNVSVSKCEILEAEHSRIKSKLELVEKQLEEMKQVVENERQKSEISVVTAAKHAEVIRKVETLNAITDSNRALRQERDNLVIQVNELRARTGKLETELCPLQEKNIELNTKAEAMQTENVSLRAECNRWRQRANILIEKSNRTSPEDWKKLQNERDNLNKLLTIEKANIVKLNDEINTLKQDKTKLEEQLKNVRAQNYAQAEELSRLKEEIALLRTQINNMHSTLEQVQEQNKKLTDENKLLLEDSANKDVTANELKNNLTQVRKIAKKYKIQCEDQTKEMETLKRQLTEQRDTLQCETSQREEQLKSEHQALLDERTSQMEQRNKEVLEQLNQQVLDMTEESENQKREIERVKQASSEKEERFKLLFKNAKDRILTLTEHNKELKEELKNQDRPGKSGDSSNGEMLAKIEVLLKEKDEMIADHLQEKERLNLEIDVLTQKVTQLQRQMGLQQGAKPSTSTGTTEKSTSEPPTANIKPMAGHSTNTQTQSVPIQPWRNAGETPLASIRPMSAQLRTVAVPPTSQSPSAVMVPPQQQVHTTGSSNNIEVLSSSPTSSHTDYVPATSSAGSSAMLGQRQAAAVPPSQSSQDADEETEGVTGDRAHSAAPQQQQQQQAVALVLPRVEPPTVGGTTQAHDVGAATGSGGSNAVTTSQAGHKRQRDADADACQADEQGKITQQSKRTRLQQTGTVSDSGLDVEYQVPTSSQRDHDDDNVIVLESDEDGGPDEGDGADDEPDDPDTEGYDIEGMEQDNYEEADCQEEEEEEAGNEVEVIDDSSEVPNQSERCTTEAHSPEENPEQPQSEAISSGTDGTSGGITISQASPSVPSAATSTFVRSSSSSSRPILPLTRPQPSHQHHHALLLPHVEDCGDDGIVPSTPTLFVPRRSDGFGEAVSSPHVPSGRFTFSDSAPPTTSGAIEAVPEQTLEAAPGPDEDSTGRSVPSTPLQSSPQEAMTGVEEQSSGQSCQSDEIPTITVSDAVDDSEQIADAGTGDMGPPAIAGTSSENIQTEGQPEDSMEGDDEVSSEGEKQPTTEEGEEEGCEAEASPSPSSDGRSRNMRGVAVARRQSRNISNRGFSRTGPTPIVWGEHRQQGLHPQRMQGHTPPNFNRMARRSRGRSPFRRF